jgi:hypothetical protein
VRNPFHGDNPSPNLLSCLPSLTGSVRKINTTGKILTAGQGRSFDCNLFVPRSVKNCPPDCRRTRRQPNRCGSPVVWPGVAGPESVGGGSLTDGTGNRTKREARRDGPAPPWKAARAAVGRSRLLSSQRKSPFTKKVW